MPCVGPGKARRQLNPCDCVLFLEYEVLLKIRWRGEKKRTCRKMVDFQTSQYPSGKAFASIPEVHERVIIVESFPRLGVNYHFSVTVPENLRLDLFSRLKWQRGWSWKGFPPPIPFRNDKLVVSSRSLMYCSGSCIRTILSSESLLHSPNK